MNTQEKIKELEKQLEAEKLEEMKKHPLYGKRIKHTLSSPDGDFIRIGTIGIIENSFGDTYHLKTSDNWPLAFTSDNFEILEDK